jgi:hypothetical protein
MQVKAGLKLKSVVCDTQIMIIKGSGDLALTCGGAEMLSAASPANIDPGALQSDKAGGTLIGKRYVNDDESVEILCVKAGAGALYIDGKPLNIKQPKALPTSD